MEAAAIGLDLLPACWPWAAEVAAALVSLEGPAALDLLPDCCA